MDWSFQLYSARNHGPWETVLETLARLGYAQVEGYGGVYDDPARFRELLDRNGLTMPSGHFSLAMLENDLDGALRTARALGIELVACPYVDASERPADAGGWRRFGERLGRIGETVTAEGLGFAWHNHDFEFAALSDGSLPMTHILEAAPGIGWEMDVAWVIVGGGSVDSWIEKYADRIQAAHVKDIAPKGENADEDGWADLGHGTVDWARIIRQLRERTGAKLFVMEHDKPADFERFARRSIETAKSF